VNGSCWPIAGWYLNLDVDFVGPHVKNRLTHDVPIGTITDTVHVPPAELDWTSAPRVELGYRFPEGYGAIVMAYRSLVSEGFSIIPGFDLDGSDGGVRSRLNLNVVDLDYSGRELSFGPLWDVQWKAGVRFASVYYDSRAEGFFLGQRSSNDFVGVGPHVGLDVWRYFGRPSAACPPRLAWFARVESAALFGRVKQAFEEVVALDDVLLLGGATTLHGSQTVPTVEFQTGLAWIPPLYRNLRLSVGYEYEVWWYLGELSGSHAELTSQGVFLRTEVRF
jgi:hypothetical protein